MSRLGQVERFQLIHPALERRGFGHAETQHHSDRRRNHHDDHERGEHTRFSEAGEGSVALVSVPGEPALSVAVTDSLDLHKFTMECVRAGAADDPFNTLDLPVKEGRIYRQGDVRSSPSWVIEYDDTRIVANWSSLVEPVIMGDLPPAPDGKAVTFSVLIFADASTITVDGKQAPGEVFERPSWRKNTGPDVATSPSTMTRSL